MQVAPYLLLLAVTIGCSNDALSEEATSFYSVDVYDPARDANADLAATIAGATKDSKRILLEVGGLW
jgi:hypothetical protein